jgi:long-chain acyl-CoA synthetase
MMIVSENCIALAACCWRRAGSTPGRSSPIRGLSARELDQIRDHSGARRMFFTLGSFEGSRGSCAALWRGNPATRPLQEIGVGPLNESATQPEPVESDPAKQVAVLIYTSGTTGTPKGVMLTHDNLLISAKTTAHFRKMEARRQDLSRAADLAHRRHLAADHDLMVGGTVRLVSKYDPAALAKAIAEEGITILNGVPATYQRLLEYKTVAGVEQLDRGSLRLIARRRRAARSRSEVARRAGIRPAAAQRLRHHRMLAGNIRRALRCAAQRSGGRHAAAGQSRPGSEQSTAYRWQEVRSASFMSAGAT